MEGKQDKLDLFKLHKAEYAMPMEPVIIVLAPAKFLAISGRGVPGGEEFAATLGALYGVAFTIKMTLKQQGQDYKIAPLEGRWWRDDPANIELTGSGEEPWNWKLLIRTPDFVAADNLAQAQESLLKKGKSELVTEVRLETSEDERVVQVLHVGPYDQEVPTIKRMLDFAESEGYEVYGPHHEIYLSDPRRTAPERLRTILRYPVSKV